MPDLPKNKGSLKNLFWLFALCCITSIFAYVLPENLIPEAPATIENRPLIGPHPLTGISDNVVVCSVDGTESHEIYLCGLNDERLLTTNIPDLKQIVWAKFLEGSCADASPNCSNSAPNCTWVQQSTDTQFNVAEPGDYRILVQYNDNSSERFYFKVYGNGLNPTAVIQNIDCGSPGNISVNNVPSNYEFSINNGASWQSSNVFSISSVSNYSIQIRRNDGNDGCTFELNDLAVANNSIDATTTVLPITCNTAKGGIEVAIATSSSNYIYTLTQGGNLINDSGPTGSNYTFSNLDAGIYDLEITLASVSNCVWNGTVTVPNFQNIQPNVVVTKNIDCSDGVLNVTQSGGVSPFEYSIDGGSSYLSFSAGNQTTIPISVAGSYSVSVRDANACVIIADPVQVNSEPEITYTVTPKDISCNGTDDGSITVDVTNTQGYSITYSIDGGTSYQTSNVFSNLAAGSYTVSIRKEKAGGSCDINATSVNVDPSPTFTASASVTQQIDCTTGSATLSVGIDTGGTAPFEYSLNGADFQNATDFSGLGAGTYTVTVKDANDCTTTADQTINAGSNPSDVSFTVSNRNCTSGEADVQLSVTGGNAPFTYSITAPMTLTAPDDTFEGLAPNTYTFEITANDGCKIVRNYTLDGPIKFSSTVTVKNNVSCATPGTSDGSLDITITDFDTTFDVVIEDGTGTPTGFSVSGATSSPLTISGLPADTYTIRINDQSGPCQQVESVTVAAPASALAVDSIALTHMNCGTPGSATIEASGGWGSYLYFVRQPDGTATPAQSNKTIIGLTQPGIHTVVVTDVNGCSYDSETFELLDQGGPTSVVDATASNYCYSTATKGILKIDVTDGEAPYFYTVNNGTPQAVPGGTFTLTDLTPDAYEIKVIGNNGCETIVADTEIAGQLFATAQITKPLGCGASPDAIIQVTPQEGYPDPDYSYEVSIDGGGFTATTVPYSSGTAGSFVFRVTDSKGCSAETDPVITEVAPALIATENISDTACGTDGTGSVELVGQGGTPPFRYSFEGSTFTTKSLYTGLDATDYNYTVRDALGCEVNKTITIGADDAITADVSHTDITCDPLNGGTQWGNTNINNVQNATGLITIELVRVRNEADYLATGWSRVYRRRENIDMSTRPGGWNERMHWPQWFFVRITDERGCTYESDFYKIDQPPLPWFQKNQADLDQSCANGATFEIEVGDPTGLVGPFEYRIWPYDPDNPPGWRSFEVAAENEALGEDTDVGAFERDLRVSGLLFGVNYGITIRDVNTGCQRWRNLGAIAAPSDDSTFDVVTEFQGKVCREDNNGEARFTITGAGDNDSDGTQRVDWRIYNAHRPTNTAFHQNGTANDGGLGGDIIVDVNGLRGGWYVIEVTSESGCVSGNRFPIYTPKKLVLELDQNVPATCTTGNQIGVTATGGWNDETNYNRRNKLYQNWHPYEYAFVVNGTDPNTLPASEWQNQPSKEVFPSAYDGTNNSYQVYVRDGGGCIKGLSGPITLTRDAQPQITGIDVPNRCSSTNEIYTVNATIVDGEGANVYIWDGEVTTAITKNLGPGNHTLVVRDENGCIATENIFIYPQMVAKANITQAVQCIPANSGEVTLDVYGGSTDYTFERTDNSETNTTGVFTGLTHSTTYSFTVTDNQSGCPAQTVTVTLDAPQTPVFQIRTPVQNLSCFGANDGRVIVEQVPGSDNLDVAYEYSIDGNPYQVSNIFENLAPGSHTVSVRSAKNCIQTLPAFTISQPKALQLATPTISPFTCTASNTLGQATVTASITDGLGDDTGTAPYNYSFNGSSFSGNNSFDLPYTNTVQTVIIDVIDANGCTDQTTVNIPAAQKVTATITETQAMTCVNDAIINVMGANGTGIPNYETRELPSGNLINGTGHGTITILAGNPGTYTYELTDTATGCSARVEYVIAPFDNISATATKIADITCRGEANGELEFTVTGFGTDFTYEVFNVNNTTTPFIAAGPSSTATGATSIDTLPTGTFFVRVTDGDTGCTADTEHITIQSPTFALDFNWAITQQLSCSPGSDAQVTATPEGGWGGYEFRLVDPATPGVPIQDFAANNIFNNLTSGINYELTLRDGQGCANVTQTVSVPEIDVITITPDVMNDPSCPDATDGSISVTATRTNGPSNYQYILNNTGTGVSSVAQNGNVFNGLAEGTYTVTVTDGRGCDNTTGTITLTDPAEVTIDATISIAPSCTPNSAEITVSAGGGTSGTYEYRQVSPTLGAWQASPVFSGLGPDTYAFEARDAVNVACPSPLQVVRTITLIEPLEVAVDVSNTTINCNGESDAVLVATASKGLGGYQYQLEVNGTLQGTPQDSGIFENLGQGTYRIYVTSGADCTAYSREIQIAEPPLLQATLGTVTHVSCFGEDDGTITVNVSGGVAPYSYSISSEPQKSVEANIFENLAGGDYTVIVQDQNGCQVVVEAIPVIAPTAPLAADVVRVEDEECSTDNNGLIELNLSGGTAPYAYSVGNPNGTFTDVSGANLILSDLDGGYYEIYLRDANGCTLPVVQEVRLGVDLSASHETVYECLDGEAHSITTVRVLDESVQNYYFALDAADPYMPTATDHTQDSPIFEGLSEGVHTISIVHEGGCIEVLDTIQISLPETVSLTLEQGSINEILVSASGGDGNYTYYFEAMPQATGSYYINRDGLYTVRVTDGKGCEAAVQVNMNFIDIEIPNFFTPNNDGFKDVWSIKNNEAFPNMFVSIFDRYGRTIKKFIGNGDWDGTYNNTDLPAGDYWYVIKLNGENDEREFVGHFSIYR
ncbi:T9SS type B sorting domain-containing protein [Aggregatimonas sangjinii]|uniref:T9SS type B sorting domain-containing protein n=1 Tax=Aggregatimonas sangjinii TaxID=2583587 RepID=A0A5B7SUB2_9FLAO|nr:T9SS type B sorting domain-containing protein [Aggregatimonas sangjinii]QCX02147.1 T9SS type B sorting domain-containing protein [Aggregatimonas sangjinii]